MPKANFQDALRVLAERERQDLGHPSPDELLAYHLRQAASADKERIQDHLSVCSDCASFVLGLGPAAESESGGEALAIQQSQVEAEWRRLQGRLGAEESDRAIEPVPVPFYARLRFAYSLAAALLTALVGLTIWFPRDEAGVKAEAEANARYIELAGLELSTRGGPENAALRASAQFQEAFFILVLPRSAEEYPNYRVEIHHPDEPTRTLDGLVENVDGELTFRLKQIFRPGLYRVRLFGSAAKGEQGTFLNEYTFRAE